MGLAGFSALGDGVRGAEPVPRSTATVLSTGTATADLAPGATLLAGGGGPSEAPNVRVTVDRSTGKVTYFAETGGAMEVVRSDRLPSSARAATWLPTAVKGLVLGVLPKDARDVALLWWGDSPTSTQAMEPLPGTAFQAFAIWHDDSASQTTFAGFDWTDGEAVYRADGSRVNSARLGDVVAFADPTQNLVGMFGNGTTATKPLGDVRFGAVPVLMMGRQEESGAMRTALLLVLPAGARDVVVTAAPGATVESTEYANGGTTGDTLVVARLLVPASVGGTGATTVTWKGADGREWSNPVTG